MKRPSLVALAVGNTLLFVLVASANCQSGLTLCGRTHGTPTTLFGSSRTSVCWDACDDVCEAKSAPAQKFACDTCKGPCSCGPSGVNKALARLDEAVRSLFRTKSDCCAAYDNVCLDGPKASLPDARRESRIRRGRGLRNLDEPENFSPPSQYRDLQQPMLEGNPFEDDAVQPPPPAPSEAGGPSRPRTLRDPVAANAVSSPFRLQSPPRFDPQNARRPADKSALANSLLDRQARDSDTAPSRPQPSCRLTSARIANP